MNRIILLLLFASFLCSLQAQKINLPYDFPIKPGTEEWKKLKSGDEMVDASKISDSVLISLSTEALAKSSLKTIQCLMKYIPGATYSWIFSSNVTAVGSINQNT